MRCTGSATAPTAMRSAPRSRAQAGLPRPVRRDPDDRSAARSRRVRRVNSVLAEADAAVKRLDRRLQREGETPEGVLADLKAADSRLRALSEFMREDLGVEN